jgi:hypothetical protein
MDTIEKILFGVMIASSLFILVVGLIYDDWISVASGLLLMGAFGFNILMVLRKNQR